MLIHNVEHYAGILKNKVDLYAFVWKELQDIKLKKKKSQDDTYSMTPIMYKLKIKLLFT